MSKIRRKLRTWRTFSWSDRWVLLQAWCLLLCVDVGLRVLPFRWLRRLMTPGTSGESESHPDEDVALTIRHLAWLVRIAGQNHLYPMTCLRQSLVLQWLLDRRSVRTSLRVGVQRDGDGIAAHAWLEHAEGVIGEPQDVGTMFVRLSPFVRVCGTE